MIAGFIVEGDMEADFLKSICPAARSVALRCNGNKVRASAIADRAAPLIRTISRLHHVPIFLILDREDRAESAADFGQEIFNELLLLGPVYDLLEIVVVSRKVEDWICKDIDLLVKYAGEKAAGGKQKSASKDARALLKEMNYNKRVDGPRLLKSACVRTIAERSGTFRHLTSKIRQHNLSCFWLDPIPDNVAV